MGDLQEDASDGSAAFDIESVRTQLLSLQRSVEANASADGTVRGHADAAIWSASSWFAPFVANLPCLAVIKEPAGRYLYVNALWERSFNRSYSQWYGKTDTDLWPEEVARPILDNDRHCAETGSFSQTVERTPCGDLDSYWLVSHFPLDRQPGPAALIGYLALEITDRVRAESALRESETRYRELVETMMCGIYRAAPDGRILMVNRALVEWLGYDTAEAVYEAGARDQLRPQGEAKRMMQRLQDQGPTQISTAWIRQDGSELQVQESVNPVRRANGSIRLPRRPGQGNFQVGGHRGTGEGPQPPARNVAEGRTARRHTRRGLPHRGALQRRKPGRVVPGVIRSPDLGGRTCHLAGLFPPPPTGAARDRGLE